MRILTLADIHIGSIRDTAYVYKVMKDIIDKEVCFTKTDMVVILGDYFHRLFKCNEEYVSIGIDIMSYLVRICNKSKTAIRIVYGTESHEMNQYRLFNYHITDKATDMRVIDTVTEEEFKDKSILYVPEEYVTDKKEFYKDYLYSDKQYDYIFGHGIIVEGMPAAVTRGGASSDEKQVPYFKSGELANVSSLTVFGHYHTHVDMDGNVHYLGSLFRDSFGEEEPKVYGVITDDKIEFIENEQAYVFKTYEFTEGSSIYKDSDSMLKEIDKIKEENKEIFNGDKVGRIRIVLNSPEGNDTVFRENLKGILFNDKYISPLIKDNSTTLAEEMKDDIDEEYEYVLDNSLDITDKIYRFIEAKYNDHMSMAVLAEYVKKALK